MLGKLVKHEWNATWKLLVPVNLLSVVMTVLACITVRLDAFDSGNVGIILSAIVIILNYTAYMFVVMIGVSIYLTYRFYTSTYGDQGYLLHTLPVDKHHIIISKVLVSTGWILPSSAMMYMSVYLLFNEEDNIFMRILSSVSNMATWAGNEKTNAFAVIMTLIASVVMLFASVLKVTASISLGQLSNNHKVLASFGFYFLLYTVQQIMNGICYGVLGYINTITDDWYFGISWEYSLLSGLIYSVVYYLITWSIMDKRLNLD